MKTSDIKFQELCDEIDYWKERTKKAEENAEYWKNEYSIFLKESNISAKKNVATALLFALSAEDDKDGNLIIKKGNRKELANRFNTQ